jgi:hypothetical protein
MLGGERSPRGHVSAVQDVVPTELANYSGPEDLSDETGLLKRTFADTYRKPAADEHFF